MTRPSSSLLEPRKSPRQARSAATVAAIHTAAIQVLLADGVTRLTTTRVAERAGVSVGTMYQYFPHKEALLFAVVREKLMMVVAAMEAAAATLAGQSLAAIAEGLADAWLEAKTDDIVSSRAIYGVASEFDITDVTRAESERLVHAVESLLASASDAAIERPGDAALMLLAVMGGSVRIVLERGAQDTELDVLRGELPRVCRAYLASCAKARAHGAAALTPA